MFKIQSLYMFLAAAFVAAMFFMPLAQYTSVDKAVENLMVYNYVWIAVFIGLSALVPLVTIFFFRDKLLQIRLLIPELLLLAAAQCFVIIYVVRISNAMNDLATVATRVHVGVAFPVVAAILVYLALHNLSKQQRKELADQVAQRRAQMKR